MHLGLDEPGTTTLLGVDDGVDTGMLGDMDGVSIGLGLVSLFSVSLVVSSVFGDIIGFMSLVSFSVFI